MKICAVSYLNAKPFIEGLNHYFSPDELTILTDIPSRCLEYYRSGEADVVLAPVGSLVDLPEAYILDEFCIGATGKVDSVFLFANQPVETVETVYLDAHSRTSNGLARILFAQRWNRQVEWLSEPDYFDRIDGPKAGVVIGDKAVPLRGRFQYVYDLATEWAALTAEHPETLNPLPFAFAVWLYRPGIPAEILAKIKNAFAYGVAHSDEVAEKWAAHFQIPVEQAADYYKNSIDYIFDDAKKRAVQTYLRWLCRVDGSLLPELFFENR